MRGTSLVVQWLRLHAPNAGGLCSIPCQGTRSHMLKLKVPHNRNEDPMQTNKYFEKIIDKKIILRIRGGKILHIGRKYIPLSHQKKCKLEDKQHF